MPRQAGSGRRGLLLLEVGSSRPFGRRSGRARSAPSPALEGGARLPSAEGRLLDEVLRLVHRAADPVAVRQELTPVALGQGREVGAALSRVPPPSVPESASDRSRRRRGSAPSLVESAGQVDPGRGWNSSVDGWRVTAGRPSPGPAPARRPARRARGPRGPADRGYAPVEQVVDVVGALVGHAEPLAARVGAWHPDGRDRREQLVLGQPGDLDRDRERPPGLGARHRRTSRAGCSSPASTSRGAAPSRAARRCGAATSGRSPATRHPPVLAIRQ